MQLEYTYGQKRHDKKNKDLPEVVLYDQSVLLSHLQSKIGLEVQSFFTFGIQN